LIPTILLAQYRYDGRRIWPSTIDSTKFTQDRSSAIGPAVIGGVQMVDATLGYLWIPVDWDSIASTGSTPNGIKGAGAWSLGADNQPLGEVKGTEPGYKVFSFDAYTGTDGDDSVWVNFMCPANYKDDTMELYLLGFHLEDAGVFTDSIVIGGSVEALCATDTTKSLWESGTAMTKWADILTYTGPGENATSDSILFSFNLDPEVEDLDSGDLIRVLIYFDEDRCDLGTDEEFYIIGLYVTWDILDVP